MKLFKSTTILIVVLFFSAVAVYSNTAGVGSMWKQINDALETADDIGSVAINGDLSVSGTTNIVDPNFTNHASAANPHTGSAASGANSDITSITGLTTDLTVAQGGTGASDASTARSNLSAAASGANADITSTTALDTVTPSGGKFEIAGDLKTAKATSRATFAGPGGTVADENTYEIGAGYINLSRDDTAAARHIQFGKNGNLHSGLMTDTGGFHVVSSDGNADFTIDTTGNVDIPDLAGSYGSGSAYVCVLDSGELFASDSACP